MSTGCPRLPAAPRVRRGRRGYAVEARQQRLEARSELGFPFALSAPSVNPWKPWSVEMTRGRFVAARPSLNAASFASGAGVREEAALDTRRRALEQRVGEQSRKRGDAHREHAGRVQLERFDQRRAHSAVVAADVVHPEAAEQIEVPRAVGVVQVRALSARPMAVEADRAQHAHELRIDRARPEVEVALAGTLAPGPHVHAVNVSSVRPWSRGSPSGLRWTSRMQAERRISASAAGLSPDASALISLTPAARASSSSMLGEARSRCRGADARLRRRMRSRRCRARCGRVARSPRGPGSPATCATSA